MSDFRGIAFTKVISEERLPFEMHIPNTETLKTFEKTDKGEDIFYAKDIKDFFKQLNI
ncbi:type II toxin-antitoxin system RelB/DinJ family antitoxin [Bartonella henselae]|uniref:type II toxin-antitoxin system RelB/DinJ family antitoxin n=1 Tax=Bartonella henselae TaxID=38323 RepID=UPI0004B926F7|nr:type II toxin-antitoxin system RelB/DinJ family antitoxin [Bartonella henselae]MDM9983964.1 type II toxin-antitoxin system RelB/DinJ family antitoxin [Bartonella henselae]MDM9985438.1 type II toxin-antitoxin system RelB/DinJ family antitoxin [Bartonella henselae]MDM9987005.1 type II toxin-antitoxin system RelB/DinJ family antitoxin [Bartonella henselae]MDM9988456.1 type II toxin-antitoxin system RelB/DinJ family antitoxin [Bartonella henselae]MDM9989896.1 type II toxin-antitoxin system RelB